MPCLKASPDCAMRSRLKRLERLVRGEQVAIRQHDGTILYFSEDELAPAFLNAIARATHGPEEMPEEHPLVTAARNSPDPEWINSFYSSEPSEEPVEDLSEP